MAVDGDHPHRPGYELKLNCYDLGGRHRARRRHPAPPLRAPRGQVRRGHGRARPRVLLGREHLHARPVDALVQGELLQVHQRDAALPRGRVGEQRARVARARATARRPAAATSSRSRATRSCSSTTATRRVSFPETPLLAVLPGTGGLTRLVDKRKVRRDRADVFCTPPRASRASARRTGASSTRSCRAAKWDESVARAREGARRQAASHARPGVRARRRSSRRSTADGITYRYVELTRRRRGAHRRTSSCARPTPPRTDELAAAGAEPWALRAFRELDDALLHLRFDYPDDRHGHRAHAAATRERRRASATRRSRSRRRGFAREVRLLQRRVLKRFDNTARSFFAVADAAARASPARCSSSRSAPIASTC